MIAAGIVDFIVAIMIILGLPQSAEWAIGLFVGINFLFGGCSLTRNAPVNHNRRGQIADIVQIFIVNVHKSSPFADINGEVTARTGSCFKFALRLDRLFQR